MFLRKAMRYYRLWIYTCNAVLLVSVLVFVAVSIGILSNQNLSLVPTPAPYQPTILYGYLALILQAGVLQTIGCFGALRLCQKLLNIYWFLLLSLLLGDLLVGFIWLFRFSHLTDGMKPYLKNTFNFHYGKEKEITEIWDSIQISLLCCGAEGPMDYYNVSSTTILPASCCHVGDPISFAAKRSDYIALNVPQNRPLQRELPVRNYTGKRTRNNIHKSSLPRISLSCGDSDKVPYLKGCSDHIIKWYKNSAETLMIFGFCVITFVKLCFVGILRFEIQEMIQKIKIIQGDVSTPPNPELAAALGMICGEKAAEAGLLIKEPEEEPKDPPGGTTQIFLRQNHISSHIDGGADSDTNSYCALITDTPVRNPHQAKKKPNGNNNEITELLEFRHIRQTQI